MSLQFNADAMFEIGIQIEKNGQRFYREAAQRTSDSEAQKLFADLADWEAQHVAFFERLRTTLPERARQDDLFDPDQEAVAYVEAAASSHVFVESSDIATLVAQCDTVVKALNLAVAFEKDSIVYYVSMKKMVADHLGREKIDLLIDEELHHIALLNSRKKQFASLE